MDARTVAERNANHRPGYRLLACEPAGLPMSMITVDAVLQRRKPISPLEEFVLRAIRAGVNTPEAVAEFLGIGENIAVEVIGRLYLTDAVDTPIVDGERRLVLAAQGEARVEELEATLPEESEVWFTFNRLTWSPAKIRQFDLIPEADARDDERVMIPPKLMRKIELEDFTVAEADAATKASGAVQNADADLLVLRRVVHRARKVLPCHLLIFGNEAGESAFEIAIDGHIDERLGDALEALGGAEFLKIAVEPAAPDMAPPNDAVAEALASATSLEDQDAVRQAHEWDEMRDADADPAAQVGRSPLTVSAERDAKAGTGAAFTSRVLDTYELGDYLQDAVERATRRLLIVAPWVTRTVVKRDFVRKLRTLANAGVVIHIGYGYPDNERDGNHPDAVKDLEALAEQFPNVVVGRLGDTHAKFLVCDDEYVNGSFNWLSFRGAADRTYRQEKATLVANHHTVDAQYEAEKSRIEQAAGKTATT